MVFDASAKTSTGISPTKFYYQPNLYPLLTQINISFRMHPIGMSSDISKMFQKVEVHPEDMDLHQFIQKRATEGSLKDMRMSR